MSRGRHSSAFSCCLLLTWHRAGSEEHLVYEEPSLLRSRRKMIQHNAMVQMLMERTVLTDIQSTRSDRGWDQDGERKGIPQKVRRFMYMNNCTLSEHASQHSGPR